MAVAVSCGRIWPGLAIPSSASVSCSGGISRRGTPAMKPAEPKASGGFGSSPQGAPRPPCTRAIFSACVMASSTRAARRSGGNETSSQLRVG